MYSDYEFVITCMLIYGQNQRYEGKVYHVDLRSTAPISTNREQVESNQNGNDIGKYQSNYFMHTYYSSNAHFKN